MKHRRIRIAAALILGPAVTVGIGGCEGSHGTSTSATTTTAPSKEEGDVVRMPLGGETFVLEIADSPSEHQHGLMARGSMPADRGMIFVFPEEEERSFWMKDTLLPLDIIYVSASGRVVSVKPMKPRDLTPVPSDGDAMYAIELNLGAAARAGVRAGDRLTIPPEILTRQAQAARQ